MILRQATIKYKGYDPEDLSEFSHKRICCSCDICGKIRWLQKSKYLKLCSSCSRKGIRAPNWKGGKVTLVCQWCRKEFAIMQSFKNQKFCSQKCYGEWRSKNFIGENNPSYRGGFDKQQKHLVPIIHSIQLNKRFEGSEGHHININTVVFIPKELHKHFYHNLKNGKNMESMNTLALQYLKGEL